MGLRPGGLGLVMTRALVDELIYNEKRNEVVLREVSGLRRILEFSFQTLVYFRFRISDS